MKTMQKRPLTRVLALLLVLLSLPILPSCGRYIEDYPDDGYYQAILHEGEDPVNIYFNYSRVVNAERCGISTVSEEVWRFYADPEMEERPYFEMLEEEFDVSRARWKEFCITTKHLSPGDKLYAEWRPKRYDLVFYNTEEYATRLHGANSDREAYTDVEFGGYIKYPDYAPKGYRLIGWFSEDLSVQYTDGTTPRQGYSTINETFFPNNEICSAIRFRPKFEPIAEE